MAEASALPTLGIIAGATELPRIVAESCAAQGRDVFILALEDACEDATVAAFPHAWVRLGAIGKAIKHLHEQGVQDVVLAGKVHRPKLASLRPDLKATKLLARLGTNLLKGDDELLRGIIMFLEDEGFRLVGVDDVAPELVTPKALISKRAPTKKEQADIDVGIGIAHGIGALDIGQSVIIQQHQILGVEAIEGTDALIRRCADLKPDDAGGVLVKVKKPTQEVRVDLPTVGVATVERIAECGFAGIAIEAGSSLMLERDKIARRADELGVFVVGF